MGRGDRRRRWVRVYVVVFVLAGSEDWYKNVEFRGYTMGICIRKTQNISYLYLCGIRPEREVKLDEGITLMPAVANPKPDDMIDSIMKSNHASELELGVLIATLRMTTAQIRIEGVIGKELAVKTWNTQQICVQMSAILNCDLAWYFQADRPVEMFNAETNVHIVMMNMYKLPDKCVDLSNEQCQFLEERIVKACRLADENEKYHLATNAMWSHRLNFMPAIRVSVVWSGIEALFMVDHNIKNTIAEVSSRFVYGNNEKIENIKILYKEARCKATHEYKSGADELYEKSNELLHKLILKCIDEGDTPDVNMILASI